MFRYCLDDTSDPAGFRQPAGKVSIDLTVAQRHTARDVVLEHGPNLSRVRPDDSWLGKVFYATSQQCWCRGMGTVAHLLHL